MVLHTVNFYNSIKFVETKGIRARATTSLAKNQDIYVYSDNDEQSAHAAQTLQSSGFARVSQLIGGLSAWKTAGDATEGL